MKIDIIGSYPPPYGGISIHIKRLSEHLNEVGIKHTIYDTAALLSTNTPLRKGGNVVPITSPIKWALKYLFFSNSDIVHLDAAGDWKLRLYSGLVIGLIRRKKVVITNNGSDLVWPYAISCLRKPDSSFSAKLITKLVIYSHKRASFIICVNPDIRELMLSLGVRPERTEIVPAFIPPVVKKEDITRIPQEVLDFIESHTPVISAGAFRINFYNGQDIYGIDMCIELCANLKSIYPQIGLVFCVPNIGDYDYFSKMKREIRDKNIENNFLFITQPLDEVYPIWQKSDIFVRPTVSDGDAVSLREALYLKTPSVASDVVPRPEGTILFKNRNMEDFVVRVKMAWDNYDYYKSKVESLEVENGLNKILEVYSSLASKHKTRKNCSHI